ncbi:MAG: RelA/SpoT domain-containing protein [Akkermansia sp.]
MVFELREYTKSQVRKAGNILKDVNKASEEELLFAMTALINFRAIHGYPLNTFQSTLRTRLKSVSKTAIVAQRIKRLPTILAKLQRFPQMQLDRMQDIGGLRAIVANSSELDEIYSLYKSAKRFPHKLVEEKDYLHHPKDSGYRGRHLVYQYNSHTSNNYNYNGLRIEIQLRTRLQHTWATAVETFEAFLGEKFKSSIGNKNMLEFFTFVSSAFALMEKQPVLVAHEQLTRRDIFLKIAQDVSTLDIQNKIQSFSIVTKHIVQSDDTGYGVLTLDPSKKSVQFLPYRKTMYKEAYERYTQEEHWSKESDNRQVVLVQADSVKQLKKAYPNYFADLSDFSTKLKVICKEAEAMAMAMGK